MESSASELRRDTCRGALDGCGHTDREEHGMCLAEALAPGVYPHVHHFVDPVAAVVVLERMVRARDLADGMVGCSGCDENPEVWGVPFRHVLGQEVGPDEAECAEAVSEIFWERLVLLTAWVASTVEGLLV